MKKKIIAYWSPFIDNVGTINAVSNSAEAIVKFNKKKIETVVINAFGEWNNYKFKYAKKLSLLGFDYYKLLPRGGFVKSRISFMIIYLLSFFPLLKFLKKKKPDFLIIHLITSLPLIILILFNFNTKIILRISGYTKMNFLRKILWKLAGKKLYLVTCPSKETRNDLIKKKIFPGKKIKTLYDPILDEEIINKRRRERNSSKYKNYILAIGRLTHQKNFILLIKSFYLIQKKFKDSRLIIAGNGEQKNLLLNLLKYYKISKKVKMVGFVKNIFPLIDRSKCVICTSLWEDPGAILIEAGFCKKFVISSDCKNGPKEIINNNNGLLFKSGNHEDLYKKYIKFIKTKKSKINQMRNSLNKFSYNFTSSEHSKKLYKFLNTKKI